MNIVSTDVFTQAERIDWQSVGDGVRRKILSYEPQMMMVYVEFKRGSIGPMHRHPHTQMTYIASGAFEVSIDGKKQVLKGGDCFYIPSDLDHGVVALEDSTLVDVFTPVREDFLPAEAARP